MCNLIFNKLEVKQTPLRTADEEQKQVFPINKWQLSFIYTKEIISVSEDN